MKYFIPKKFYLIFYFFAEKEMMQWKSALAMEELHCGLAGARCSVSVSVYFGSMNPQNFSHKGTISQLVIGSFNISLC